MTSLTEYILPEDMLNEIIKYVIENNDIVTICRLKFVSTFFNKKLNSITPYKDKLAVKGYYNHYYDYTL